VPGTVFISDLHLDPGRPAVTAALAGFLHDNTHRDALYILGDLFEAWVGDDDDAALASEVATLLEHFARSGPDLYLMRGNRDFLLGDAYCARCKATLLDDPSVIDLYGEPTLLMHGDSLCTADAEYMRFRRTARDPAWQAELLGKPLAERRELAAQLRAMSADANSNKAEDIMDVTPSEVQRVMQSAGVRRLLHGHTHRPARHQEPAGERIVLGDWHDHGWYVEAAPGRLELISFRI
jgi:UDP-2,3-diacylglucosamine hydrolase